MQNLLSLNLMKKITLIFLLFAKMKQTFLTLAFIFSLSVCFSQTNKNLFLDMRLSTDTIYASNDIFTISAQIKNIGFFPQKLYTNGCISENVKNQSVNDGEMYIVVKKNGKEYRYYESVILNKHDLPRKRILWLWRKIKFKHDFYMNRFISTEQKLQGITKNEDYGEYEIQGVFVTEFNDTIRSEVKKIWYLEK